MKRSKSLIVTYIYDNYLIMTIYVARNLHTLCVTMTQLVNCHAPRLCQGRSTLGTVHYTKSAFPLAHKIYIHKPHISKVTKIARKVKIVYTRVKSLGNNSLYYQVNKFTSGLQISKKGLSPKSLSYPLFIGKMPQN